MNNYGQIVAIGGGGFGRNPNKPVIEEYILKLSNVSKPKIAFFPTASAEDSYFVYPKKKPSIFKKANKKILPIKKPATDKKIIKIDKSFLLPKNKPESKKNKTVVEKQKDIKKEIEKVQNKEPLIKNIADNKFLYPKKKPKSYKSPLKEVKTSSILSKKDFEKAKEVLNFVKATGTTIYHYVGTCKMGNDKYAVVDDRLRVRKIQNLRIADASIMPEIVSSNTAATVLMIAEKVSDLIKEDNK